MQVYVAPASCRLSRGRLALGVFTNLSPRVSDATNKRGRVARDHPWLSTPAQSVGGDGGGAAAALDQPDDQRDDAAEE